MTEEYIEVAEGYGVQKYDGGWYPVMKGLLLHRRYETLEEAIAYVKEYMK